MKDAKISDKLSQASKKSATEHKKLETAWKEEEVARNAQHASQLTLEKREQALAGMKKAYLADADKIAKLDNKIKAE